MARTYGKYVIPVLFVLALVLSIFIIKPFIIALLTSGIIAYIFYPVYRWVKKGVKNETVSALLVSLLILVLITIPIILIVNALSKDAYAFYLNTRTLLSNGEFLKGCTAQACSAAKDFLGNAQVQLYLQKGLQTASTHLIGGASDLVVAIPRRVLEVFITFFATFYLLRDGSKLTSSIKNMLVAQKMKKKHILHRFDQVMYAVLFGALLVALVQGALGAIGFALFGVSSPLLWGMVMFFLALIPYMGTAIVWVPASLLMVINGVISGDDGVIGRGVGLFFYGLLVISSIDNIIKPKIIGDRSRVHPVLVLTGTLGGLGLMGIPGIIVGPVVLGMTITFLELYVVGK